MPSVRNFLPGPTWVHPDVMAAMQEPMFAHYGPRMTPYLEEIQPALRAMLGTSRPVFGVTCSGTGLIESAVRNAVIERVLVVSGGFFGDYFARIAERCGKQVVKISVPLGRTLEADQLEQLLDGPAVDAVALVHSESSTGALAPLGDLARVVRQRSDAMLLVDAVSSAGGTPIEMDRLGIDYVITGCQKAMALPPGLAFGAVSERLAERARTIEDAGYYFSVTRWVKMAADHQLIETPALSIYLALHRQLRRIAAEGGWEARWERHRRLAEMCHAWAAGQPAVRVLAPEGRRSPTVTALQLADGLDAAAIASTLEADGFLLGKGITPEHGQMLRIGHMGEVQPSDLEDLFAALEPLLAR